MGLVPHLEYSFIDKINNVDVRGTRYGRVVDMTLHVSDKCGKCFHIPTEEPVFLAIDVNPLTLEAGALLLRKTGHDFAPLW
jgi:hypothetical protein